MSKVFFVLLIILVSQFTPFVKRTQAFLGIGETAACTSNDVQISYANPANNTANEKTFFPENSGDLIFQFTINNTNTLNTLNGKQVFLHIPNGWFGSDTYDSVAATVNGTQFQLTIPSDKSQAKNGYYEGSLYWPEANGRYTEFCSQIKYQVGAVRNCTIGQVPSEIPPNTSLTIPFIGLANQKYKLNYAGNDLSETTTDSSGQGVFTNVIIPGNTGQIVRLVIFGYYAGSVRPSQCETKITIKATAASPSSPAPSGSVLPRPVSPATTPCTGLNCSSGGGKPTPGCTDDPKNPAIATAIGCIHTQPAALVKDLLTFIIGIGGGLAFLMMLLGVFQMLTSAGNPETLSAGRDRFQSAIIGLLFIIFSVLLLRIIGVDILGLGEQFGFK